MKTREQILIIGSNWIGDAIMSMPAVQAYRRTHPDASLTFLVKPSVADLWSFHDAPDAVWTVVQDRSGMRRAIRQIRDASFQRAFIFPRSFRAAWIPWRAGIPERRGAPGNGRSPLLTHVQSRERPADQQHQLYQYANLLLPTEQPLQWDPPQLTIPDDLREQAMERVRACSRPLVALLPGAARGLSKQWPVEHFVALGRQLQRDAGCSLVTLGAPAEFDLCQQVASQIGPSVLNLAGQLSFKEWVALISILDVVVANDSGGMHVAGALDRPLVAMFGLTDPAVTGPFGGRVTILQSATQNLSRRIARNAPEARAALAAITPQQAYQAVSAWL